MRCEAVDLGLGSGPTQYILYIYGTGENVAKLQWNYMAQTRENVGGEERVSLNLY